MQATKIKDGIYWVGAIDWGLRSFHGYATDKGSTYNAYLIIDEKITLIDNVKEKFTDEMMARIASIIDPSKIDVIISNHGEPDHSGSLPHVLKIANNATVYAAHPQGGKILVAQYGQMAIEAATNNGSISIGKRTLQFFHAPMVHWPDNMVTYIPEEKIAFSNDIFGQHYATSKLFDDEVDLETALFEAKKYYANIVLPYTKQAKRILDVVKALDIELIATSHGVIWRSYIAEVINLYDALTTNQKQNKAVVVYDTMWESTKKMAIAITEAFRNQGIPVFLTNVNDTEHSDLITEIMDSKYLAVGSPTLNNQLLPPIAAFLSYLHGLSPTNLLYIAFGSYGWGGQSIPMIDASLQKLGYQRLVEPIKYPYIPDKVALAAIEKQISEALKTV